MLVALHSAYKYGSKYAGRTNTALRVLSIAQNIATIVLGRFPLGSYLHKESWHLCEKRGYGASRLVLPAAQAHPHGSFQAHMRSLDCSTPAKGQPKAIEQTLLSLSKFSSKRTKKTFSAKFAHTVHVTACPITRPSQRAPPLVRPQAKGR